MPPAGLSIAIADGASEVHSGSTVRYTATVTNAGSNAVSGTLEIAVPLYVKLAAGTASKNSGSVVSWPVKVSPGGSARETIEATVGDIPKGEVRVTTLATLFAAGSKTQILVRSADPDLIRGVRDPAHTVVRRENSRHSTDVNAILVVVVVVVAAAVGVGLVLFLRRRRSRRRRSTAVSGPLP